jgi:hypothetical protein
VEICPRNDRGVDDGGGPGPVVTRDRPTRRGLLAAGAAALTGLAGCSGARPTGTTTTTGPATPVPETATETTTPTPTDGVTVADAADWLVFPSDVLFGPDGGLFVWLCRNPQRVTGSPGSLTGGPPEATVTPVR